MRTRTTLADLTHGNCAERIIAGMETGDPPILAPGGGAVLRTLVCRAFNTRLERWSADGVTWRERLAGAPPRLAAQKIVEHLNSDLGKRLLHPGFKARGLTPLAVTATMLRGLVRDNGVEALALDRHASYNHMTPSAQAGALFDFLGRAAGHQYLRTPPVVEQYSTTATPSDGTRVHSTSTSIL